MHISIYVCPWGDYLIISGLTGILIIHFCAKVLMFGLFTRICISFWYKKCSSKQSKLYKYISM